MDIITNLKAALKRVAEEFNAAKTARGDLSALGTTQKTNLVGAINEVLAGITSSAGAKINDSAAAATTTYSSTKIEAQLLATKNSILGGASGAFDTLKELQDALEADKTGLASLLTEVGTKLGPTAQTYTTAQQTQMQSNINVYSKPEIDGKLGTLTDDLTVYFESQLA